MPYAATYQVEVYSNPDSALSSTNRVVSLTTRSTAAIATSALAKGDYGWRVRRVDINGVAGAWTTETNAGLRRFKVAGPVPTLVAPADGAKLAGNSVLLRWQPVAGATRYKVEVSKDNFATIFETVTTDMTSWAPGLLSPKWSAGAYAWRVTTLDSSGKALATSAKRTLSILTVPGAPTSPRATAGNSSAVVTWTAPTNKGGSTITKYTVTSSPGGKTATTSGATTATVTGLTNGTSYTFTVTATNATGTSVAVAARRTASLPTAQSPALGRR